MKHHGTRPLSLKMLMISLMHDTAFFMKKKRVKYDTQPKWLTSELLELIKSRDQKLKKAKYSNLPEDWLDLKRTKNKVTAAIRSAKKKFFHQSFEENGNNPKKL